MFYSKSPIVLSTKLRYLQFVIFYLKFVIDSLLPCVLKNAFVETANNFVDSEGGATRIWFIFVVCIIRRGPILFLVLIGNSALPGFMQSEANRFQIKHLNNGLTELFTTARLYHFMMQVETFTNFDHSKISVHFAILHKSVVIDIEAMFCDDVQL